MPRFMTIQKTSIAFSLALAVGFLLVPVTVTPNGVEASVACGAEGAGPDGNCTFSYMAFCLFEGEYVNNQRRVNK